MTHVLLSGGRATRFAPGAIRERDTLRRAPVKAQRGDTAAEQHLGLAAGAVLGSESFWQVLDAITNDAHDEFAASEFGPGGDVARAKAHARLNAIQEIIARASAMKENGTIAEAKDRDDEPERNSGLDD